MPGLKPRTPGFNWRPAPWGHVLVCEALRGRAAHAFTDRSLEVLAGDATSVGIWGRLGAYFGVPAAHVIRLRQVHGAEAVNIRPDAALPAVPPAADIVFTERRDVVLAVQAADCVPIVLADVEGRVIAAVHAGWRGTLAGAAALAVARIQEGVGVDPSTLVAAIGPSIGPCCYGVGHEVADAFRARGYGEAVMARWFAQEANGRLTLDLWQANADQLSGAGVPRAAIHLARLCTATHVDTFPSYRAEGARAGRLMGAIRLESGDAH